MLEFIQLEMVLWILIICFAAIVFHLDRLSKRLITHIDDLQIRVNELEEKCGIKEPFDPDPLGFTRDE